MRVGRRRHQAQGTQAPSPGGAGQNTSPALRPRAARRPPQASTAPASYFTDAHCMSVHPVIIGLTAACSKGEPS